MSLSSLHNPTAAAELIADFKRRFSTKICMAPYSDHEGKIVSAHTMSLEAVLRKISTDGHVYAQTFGTRFSEDSPPISISRQGLRSVSVFNGFCAKHDVSLFSCLENETFLFNRQQLFMLAYRAATRECYLKRKQCESLPSLEQIKSIHGITENIAYTEEVFIHQAASLRGAEELEQLKSKLDEILVSKSWDRMETHAIMFEKPPCLTSCFVFQPFYDLNGKQLQEYENLEAEMSHLAISVIPTDQGTAAIFSWLDTANNAPRRFFDSVVESTKRTSAVIHTVLDNSENFALSPEWYEHLPDKTKDYLLSRSMSFASSIEYNYLSRPEYVAPLLADWGSSLVVSF
jgi:hypothetical protein